MQELMNENNICVRGVAENVEDLRPSKKM